MRNTIRQDVARNDAALLSQVRAGNTEAYAELWRRHQGVAINTASLLVPHAEVQDVVSETHAQLYKTLKKGDGPHAAFRPYLVQSVRNSAMRWYRNKGERADSLEEVGDISEQPNQVGLETRLVLFEAFAKLPVLWQQVLWATDVEQAPPREIAQQVGLTANNVGVIAHRARQRLRELWLELHLPHESQRECEPIHAQLPAYFANRLSKGRATRVNEHLAGCSQCRATLEASIGDAKRLHGLVPFGATLVAATLATSSRATAAVSGSWMAKAAVAFESKVGVLALTGIVVAATAGGVVLANAAQQAGTAVGVAEPGASHTRPLIPTPKPSAGGSTARPADVEPAARADMRAQRATVAAPGGGLLAPAEAVAAPETVAVPVEVLTVDSGGGHFFPHIAGVTAPDALVRITGMTDTALYTRSDHTGGWSLLVPGGIAGTNQVTVTAQSTVTADAAAHDPATHDPATHDPAAQNPAFAIGDGFATRLLDGEGVELTFTLHAPDLAVTVGRGTIDFRAEFDPAAFVAVSGPADTFRHTVTSATGVASGRIHLPAGVDSQTVVQGITARFVSADGKRFGPSGRPDATQDDTALAHSIPN